MTDLGFSSDGYAPSRQWLRQCPSKRQDAMMVKPGPFPSIRSP